jgi:hypothetical protein
MVNRQHTRQHTRNVPANKETEPTAQVTRRASFPRRSAAGGLLMAAVIDADDDRFHGNVQTALDAAAGATIAFSGARTYEAAGLRVRNKTHVLTNGCVFRHAGSGNRPALVVEGNGVVADQIQLEIPTGVDANGISIEGKRFACNRLSVTSPADVPQTEPRRDYGIRFENAEDAIVGSVICENVRYAVVVSNSVRVTILQGNISRALRAFWYTDSHDCQAGACRVHGRAPLAGDLAGHNALLIGGSSSDLTFSDWHISDLGEHGVRVSGAASRIGLVRFRVHDCGGSGIKVFNSPDIADILIDSPIIWNVATLGGRGSGVRLEQCKRIVVRSPVIYKVGEAQWSAVFGIYLREVNTCDIICPRISDTHRAQPILDDGGTENIRRVK